VVCDTSGSSQQHLIRDDPFSDWRHIIRYEDANTFTPGVNTDAAFSITSVATTPDLHIFTVRWMSADQLYIFQEDGEEKLNQSLPGTKLNNPGTVSVGSHPSLTLSFSGGIREIIYHSSAEDLDKVVGYLAHKWGLESNLPSGHPYKSNPP